MHTSVTPEAAAPPQLIAMQSASLGDGDAAAHVLRAGMIKQLNWCSFSLADFFNRDWICGWTLLIGELILSAILKIQDKHFTLDFDGIVSTFNLNFVNVAAPHIQGWVLTVQLFFHNVSSIF